MVKKAIVTPEVAFASMMRMEDEFSRLADRIRGIAEERDMDPNDSMVPVPGSLLLELATILTGAVSSMGAEMSFDADVLKVTIAEQIALQEDGDRCPGCGQIHDDDEHDVESMDMPADLKSMLLQEGVEVAVVELGGDLPKEVRDSLTRIMAAARGSRTLH